MEAIENGVIEISKRAVKIQSPNRVLPQYSENDAMLNIYRGLCGKLELFISSSDGQKGAEDRVPKNSLI